MKEIRNKLPMRISALVIVVVMTLSLAACSKDPASQPSSGTIISNSSSLSSSSSSQSSSQSSGSSDSSSSESGSGSSTSGSSSGIVTDTRAPSVIQAELLTKMVAHHQQNQDTVGWLYFPGTEINEAVVQAVDSNDTYLRRNSYGKEDFYGCYYVDFRGIATNREELSKNTVIYGHSMSDDPNSVKFGQLNKLLDIKFAEANQFIYFSTPESEMVWQIFAVFDTKINFIYNNPNATDAELLNIINGARSRSKYNYDVSVSAKDHILTLSTCTYRIAKEYPNDYRYVVMAKLLDKGATPTPTKVEVNPSIAQP